MVLSRVPCIYSAASFHVLPYITTLSLYFKNSRSLIHGLAVATLSTCSVLRYPPFLRNTVMSDSWFGLSQTVAWVNMPFACPPAGMKSLVLTEHWFLFDDPPCLFLHIAKRSQKQDCKTHGSACPIHSASIFENLPTRSDVLAQQYCELDDRC